MNSSSLGLVWCGCGCRCCEDGCGGGRETKGKFARGLNLGGRVKLGGGWRLALAWYDLGVLALVCWVLVFGCRDGCGGGREVG